MSDGTALGTTMVADIDPGMIGSNPSSITPLGNGVAVFVANYGLHCVELWVTDGTAAGTSLVTDIDPGSTGSNPVNFSALGNGKALFSANDGMSTTKCPPVWIGKPGPNNVNVSSYKRSPPKPIKKNCGK